MIDLSFKHTFDSQEAAYTGKNCQEKEKTRKRAGRKRARMKAGRRKNRANEKLRKNFLVRAAEMDGQVRFTRG